ncbi:MAG: Ppx/GppA family phosphatase [Pseudomonadota bacterium]
MTAEKASAVPVGRRMGDGAVGVIDVGSNSVRLVLYERASRAPAVLFNEKVLAALGEDLADTGRLSNDGMARALSAIRRFMTVAHEADANSLTIVATAAARIAENGPRFIRDIEDVAGVPVRVLDGREEAEMAANGVLCGFWQPDGVVGDLGGGSLELIDVADDQLGVGESFELGTLRLRGKAKGSLDDAETIVKEALAKARPLPLLAGRDFYAVGGTWRSLVRLHMANTRYPLSVMHHYSVPADQMHAFCDLVLKDGLDTVDTRRIVSKGRRALVPWGAVVLRELIERGRPDAVVASALGVREGLIFSGLAAAERARDPLLLASEELALLRARSPQQCVELIDWTAMVFDAVGIRESEEERRLRAAACLLSDIGWRAHPDYRGDQALAIISNVALYGIDHPGRGYLAATLHDRYGGTADSDARPAAEALCPTRLAQRAKVLAAAFKVAYVMAPGMAGILPRIKLRMEGEKLMLSLPPSLAALDGERPRRRVRQLAKLINAEGVVATDGVTAKRGVA